MISVPIECNCGSCGLEFLIPEDMVEEIESCLTCPACQEPAYFGGDELGFDEEEEDDEEDGDGELTLMRIGAGELVKMRIGPGQLVRIRYGDGGLEGS